MSNFNILQEKKSLPLSRESSRLIDAPLEVRLRIYGFCLPRGRVIYANCPSFSVVLPPSGEKNTFIFEAGDDDPDFGVDLAKVDKSSNGIFSVSKQVSEEALDILYGQNLFQLYLHAEGELLLRKNFSERNRQRMRHMLVVLQPLGFLIQPSWKPDHRLWSSILRNLVSFRLVAQEPFADIEYHDVLRHEQEMDMWLVWINPLLACFSQHLQIGTRVQVDFDEKEKAGELVKEHLTCGYQTIQCHVAGDRIFRRGRYSFESGYFEDVIVTTDLP